MRFALWISLLASISFAQPLDYSTGGNLKTRQYQTYAAMTLFVDPTGSDSNACTASGIDACATPQGAANRIPPNVRHLVTMNIAAGTYASTLTLERFTFSGAGQLVIVGSNYTNFSPITGTATGAVTAYTPPTISQFAQFVLGTVTDSGQAWTVNNLKGHFLTITSGPAIGLRYPIISNTATTISVGAPFSGLVAGNTYAIQDPSAIITGAILLTSLSGNLLSASVGGVIQLESLSILGASPSNAQALLEIRNSMLGDPARGTSIQYKWLRVVNTSTARSAVRILSSWVSSGTSLTTALPQPSYFANSGANVSSVLAVFNARWHDNGGTFIRQEGGTATGSAVSVTGGSICAIGTSFGGTSFEGGVASTGTTFNVASNVGTANSISLIYAYFKGAATSTALNIGGLLGSSTATVNAVNYQSLTIDTAATGILLQSGARLTSSGTSVTPSFTSVTNEVSVDSVVYTYAAILAMAPPRVIGSEMSYYRVIP